MRPLRWHDPARVFTCSWSDWFHADADAWRPEAWDIVRRTGHLAYQVLTKRTGRILRHLPGDWGAGWPHVWLGATTEHQGTAFRARQLAQIPAATRFLSCEPLLGPLTFRDELGTQMEGIDWVIVGGESGAKRREMDIAAACALIDECRLAGVPVFVKQDSGFQPGQQGRIPDDYLVREYPASVTERGTNAHL